MLMGLGQSQAKMSKSDPASAIFMEDTEKDVQLKVKKSFCPPGQVQDNPCFDYLKQLVFQKFDTFTVERDTINGGNKTYSDYDEVAADFTNGSLHPADLKPALAKSINAMIEPVRQHFDTEANAKKLLS